MNFEGRASVVTGASQGIGEAIALELSRAGSEVILVDVQKEKLEEVAERIKESKGRASTYYADVSRLDQATKVVEEVLEKHKKVDHLVNNAGITNQEGNVLGLMPHPERASEALLGSEDGRVIFE